MKKAFATYFFSLCVLLMIGYGQGYARTALESVRTAQVGNPPNPQYARFHNTHYGRTFITNPSPLGTEKSLEIEAIDIEEEQLSSLKRYLGGSSFLTAVFCTLTIGCFFHCLKMNLHYGRSLPNITSPRWYIVFRVIRL